MALSHVAFKHVVGLQVFTITVQTHIKWCGWVTNVNSIEICINFKEGWLGRKHNTDV